MIAKMIEALKRRRAAGQRIFSMHLARSVWARMKRGAGWESPSERFRHLFELNCVEHAGSGEPFDVNRLRLEWIVPQFDAGGGGHAIIFRLAAELGRRGHRNRFWVLPGDRYANAEEIRQGMRRLYDCDADTEVLDPSNVDLVSGDVCIATAWSTAYYARAVKAVRKRCYLILDFEAAFFPVGTEALVAENTYRFPLDPIPSSRWLARKLESYYKRALTPFVLPIDHGVYVQGKGERTPDSVVFYLREKTPRRCAELGLLALEIVAYRRPSLVVHCIGQPAVGRKLPFYAVQHGLVAPSHLADLYGKAKVGFVMSPTNHSLVSIEMMACGLPVVELDYEPSQLDFPTESVTLAGIDPRAMADAIERLLDDKDRWLAQQAAGLKHAAGLTWAACADAVEGQLKAGLVHANR